MELKASACEVKEAGWVALDLEFSLQKEHKTLER